MRKLLFIFCVSFFPVCLFGQDLRKIKEDPSYLWGAGTGQDYESMQASAVAALIHKLSSAHLIDLPAGHELAVWKTYRNDILSVSEVVWDSGTALRYIAWREVDKVFTRRKSLASSLYAKAVKASSAGNAAEAATCCDWGLTLLEVLPEDTPAKASLQAIRKGLGNVKPAAVPGLSYVGREVDEIRKALGVAKEPVPLEKPLVTTVPSNPRKDFPIPVLDRLPEPRENVIRLDVPPSLKHPRPLSFTPSYPREESPASDRPGWIALVQLAAIPSVETGLFFGMKNEKVGGYLACRSGLRAIRESYVCSSDGRTDFGHIWASGHSKYSRFSISGGILAGPPGGLAGYAGAGYGTVGCFWEDIAGQWAKVGDKSCQGLLLEAGLVWTAGQTVLTVGLSTVSFSTLSPVIGLGLCF